MEKLMQRHVPHSTCYGRRIAEIPNVELVKFVRFFKENPVKRFKFLNRLMQVTRVSPSSRRMNK